MDETEVAGAVVMLWINRIIALALIGAAVPLWTIVGDLPGTGADFPRVALAAIVVLSGLLLVRSFLPRLAAPRDLEGSAKPTALVRPLAVFAVTAVFAELMPRLGFFPAMLGLGIVLLPLLKVENRTLYLASLALVLVLIYVAFVLLLHVPLTASRMI